MPVFVRCTIRVAGVSGFSPMSIGGRGGGVSPPDMRRLGNRRILIYRLRQGGSVGPWNR